MEGDGLLTCVVCGKHLLAARGGHKCSSRSVANFERRRKKEQGESDRIAAANNDKWIEDYMQTEASQ